MDVLHAIEFNLFCYPEQIVLDEGIKTGANFSRKKKKITLKIVMDYEEYICGDSKEKEHMVIEALQLGFRCIEKSANRSKLNIDRLIAEANNHLSVLF